MAIGTSQGGGSSFAKILTIGDRLIGACGSDPWLSKRQQNEFNPDPGAARVLKFKDNGKPAMEEILHLVAMPGTQATTGNPAVPVGEGDVVRFSLSGFRWFQVIEQRKLLPARAGFKQGETCSGDVYDIRVVGWSAETKNAAAARTAGFTVEGDRIILRTEAERDQWVLAQLKTGGNTNAAKDVEITVRRPTDDEKSWEQAADRLFETKPWAFVAQEAPPAPAMTGAGTPFRNGEAYDPSEDPF